MEYTFIENEFKRTKQTDLENDLRDKRKFIESYKEKLLNAARTKEKELSDSITKMIKEAVNEFGYTKKYDIILGTTLTGNILYTSGKSELTEEILLILNKKFKNLQEK